MNENLPVLIENEAALDEGVTSLPELLPARLQAYLNARVTIHYHTGVSDSGTLIYLDRTWAELLKDNGERLLIPMQAIRIIKLIKVSEPQSEANTLLRASEAK